MKNLLYKEFRLALHPTALLFLGLSALMLIPNYPYYVTFFYTSLGIFFICLTGRENQDIQYTMLLPVRKRDIVRSRFAMSVILQLLQMLIALPFVVLHNALIAEPNASGMDANVALFGLSFLMMGLFNFLFFTRYYRDPDAVGKSFLRSSIMMLVYVLIMEAMTFIVPFFRDQLDTRDPAFLPQKLAVLAVGLLAYALLTLAAYRKSVQTFEKLDL